jgi:hypothetical protein
VLLCTVEWNKLGKSSSAGPCFRKPFVNDKRSPGAATAACGPTKHRLNSYD